MERRDAAVAGDSPRCREACGGNGRARELKEGAVMRQSLDQWSSQGPWEWGGLY